MRPARDWPTVRFEEEVFGQVIREARAVDGVALEVLDAEDADVGADLEVFGIDLRALDLAPLDLRLDDRAAPTARRSRLRHGSPAARLRAQRRRRRAEQRAAGQQRAPARDQKKNAKPRYFHSSTSSLSSRLVKTTLLRYSERNMKRRVR